MKELSIEEKAKCYDEAIERAKEQAIDGYLDAVAVNDIFPELAESEDERIRKALMQNLKERFGTKGNMGEGLDMPEVLAWLEKQAEQISANSAKTCKDEQKPAVDTKVIVPKFRVGDIVKSKSQPMLSPRKIISIGKDCYWCEDRGCIGFAWEDDCEIVEQKPAWSEEDRCMLNNVIDTLKPLGETTHSGYAINSMIDWLKSLRPQSAWKPTEGQMKSLKEACDEHWEPDGLDPLYTLWIQLKKLKEA